MFFSQLWIYISHFLPFSYFQVRISQFWTNKSEPRDMNLQLQAIKSISEGKIDWQFYYNCEFISHNSGFLAHKLCYKVRITRYKLAVVYSQLRGKKAELWDKVAFTFISLFSGSNGFINLHLMFWTDKCRFLCACLACENNPHWFLWNFKHAYGFETTQRCVNDNRIIIFV